MKVNSGVTSYYEIDIWASEKAKAKWNGQMEHTMTVNGAMDLQMDKESLCM